MSSSARQLRPSEKIKRLPLQEVGFNDLASIPYLLTLTEPLHTVLRLVMKEVDIIPVQRGYTKTYTINGRTASAYDFLYANSPTQVLSHAVSALRHALETDGEALFKSILNPDGPSPAATTAPPAITPVSVDSPDQFAMAWPTYDELDQKAQPYLPSFVASLTDAEEATRQFWPTLAEYSFPHNLIILDKVRETQAEQIRQLFGDTWNEQGMQALYDQGLLYALDIMVFDALALPPSNKANRYTHATYTVLRQDPKTKQLEPIAILISGKNVDGHSRAYTRTKATAGAWIYALQAVKVSITVYAIWLRHVYLWHIIPSTMQMTMHNTLPTDHPIYQLMAPQSKYTIPFNEVMLLLWPIVAPPTSLTTQFQYLTLTNAFAKGRRFFDDDPKATLETLGLKQEDFTSSSPWDRYTAVKDLLELWDATEQYADTCVDATYPDDASVAQDAALKAWIEASSDVQQGNIRGLEPLDGRPALKRLLSSLLYRVVAHGGANIVASTVLVHLFASNYPICLQRNDIPEPNTELDTKTLLTYLPNTETMGIMASFYFSFAFTKPYEPFVPSQGMDTNLYFPSGLKDARNRALIAYRNALVQFVTARAILPDQVQQWPLNVET